MTTDAARSTLCTGSVAVVGAGPGVPDLLTVRATRLLAAADLIATDPSLVPLARSLGRPDVRLLELSPPAAAGKAGASARLKPLVDAARAGQAVVRLVAGDPFLFAGGAEEVAALVRADVRVDVVPGVPETTSTPLHAGIPLTSADTADVRVVDVARSGIDWESVGCGAPTLVLLNAVPRLDEVATSLVAAGRKPGTPVAVTVGGATSAQRTVVSTLAEVAADAGRAGVLDGGGVVVVGEVVSLRPRLSWFESRPLFGWRVLVPRTREQASVVSEQLIGFGAVPEEVPTIAVEPPRTPAQMDRAVKGLVTGRFEWVAFTSSNAVRAVRERFEELGLDARAFAGIKVAAVGEKTAADLLAWGIAADLVPSGEQSSAGLLADWPHYDPVFDPIDRVLLPRADIATETLVQGLGELGWQVEDVTAYRTVRAAPPPAGVREAIKSGAFDAVLFTSSSTVRNLVGIAGKPHPSTVIAVIGPQTRATAEELGLRVDVVSPQASVGALVAALADFGEARRQAVLAAGEQPHRPSEERPARRRSR